MAPRSSLNITKPCLFQWDYLGSMHSLAAFCGRNCEIFCFIFAVFLAGTQLPCRYKLGAPFEAPLGIPNNKMGKVLLLKKDCVSCKHFAFFDTLVDCDTIIVFL